MSTMKVAHIREQGQDMIIVPVNDDFRFKPQSEKELVTAAIQAHASLSGLRGRVVPVWNDSGRMGFLAPTNWHPFFRSIDLSFVWANVNREIRA